MTRFPPTKCPKCGDQTRTKRANRISWRICLNRGCGWYAEWEAKPSEEKALSAVEGVES